MTVKAAVGEVGRLHDVGDADAAKAFGAKQRARRIDDALAVQGGLFAAYSHCAPQLCGGQRALTIYMTIVINRQAVK